MISPVFRLLVVAGAVLCVANGYGKDSIGVLRPLNEQAVSCSKTNLGIYADYTFTFLPTTTIPAGGTVQVTFPQQYTSGLGLLVSPTCVPTTCSVSAYVVTFTLSSQCVRGTTCSVQVMNVLNPSAAGGTGPFQLVSRISSYVLDMNTYFGVIGIEQTPGTLTSTSVSVASGQSSYAGEASQYDFLFTVSKWTPAYSWMRFTFPSDDFIISNYPSCTSLTINGYKLPGAFSCNLSGTKVTLTGFGVDIQPGTSLGIRISLTNPRKSITTGTFSIETGRNSTNTVYEQKTGIPGLTINPGKVSGISLIPVDTTMTQSTNNIMRYTLKFKFFNPIEQGGSILIVCNNNFNLGTENLYWVNSGLTDISTTQQVTSTYSSGSNILTITNFLAYAGGAEISLMLELKNPSTSGNTLPLGIKSLKADAATIIDQDLVTAVTTISTITSPSISISYQTGGTDAEKRAGGSLLLRFIITPNLQIPELGFIKIRFPSSFSVAASPLCKMKPKNIGEDFTQACSFADGTLTATLKATTVVVPTGSGSFLVGVDSYLQVPSITAGPVAGKYSLELQTFDQSGNLLESGNALITTVASEFTACTWQSVHNREAVKTILSFAFTATQAIPASVTPTAITTPQGFIELIFDTAASKFATDLGLGIAQGGSVPCRQISGITPASSALTCTLTVKGGSTSTVRVSGFSAIAANTAVVLHIAGVMHVTSGNTPSITAYSYQVANRVRTDLNTKLLTITAPATIATTVSQGTTFTSTDPTISATTTLSGSVSLLSLASHAILFLFSSHDNGYCAATTALTCTINSIVYPNCYCYAQADMIYVQMNSNPGATTLTFQFGSIVNPSSVPGTADTMKAYLIDGITYQAERTYTNSLPLQTAGTFTSTKAQADKRGLAYVNVRMEFSMIPSHPIPSGGSVTIVIPGVFSASSSSPVPVCSPSQLAASTAAGVSCVLVGNTITLSNFQAQVAGNSIQVILSGVKNPSAGSSTGYFIFTTYNAAGLVIDQNQQVAGYSFTSSYVTGGIGVSAIDVYPSNGRAIAEYALTFSITTDLPAGAEIKITFPVANFGILTSPPDCRINVGVTYFQSCTASGNILSIIVISAVPASKLVVSVFNVANFNQGSSSSFLVSTVYDGLTLDQTTGVSSGTMVAVTTATAQPLKVNSVSADPLNEGEIATYKFNFTPSINIPTTQVFVVTFPQTFDSHIGDSLICSATGLTGYITCSVTSAWELSFTTTDSFTACSTCTIELWVYGVMNPQRISGQTSGQFKIGTRTGQIYSEYSETAGTVTFLSAPGYNNLWTFSTANTNARDTNNYVLNMTMTQTVPQTKYQGAVWVQFPYDYSLLAAVVSCESSSYWAGGVPDCAVYNNRIILNGQVSDFVGNLLIYLYNVPNPLTELTANSITAKTYDGLNHKVLDSSYANTNPTRIAYTYPGPLIVVNKDRPIYVERGTVSNDIPVELSYPAALNLTLVPQADEFTFMPYTVSITIGDLYHSFRIAVHESVPATAYVMTWTTEGDNIPPYYTPIQASLVIVTKNLTTLVQMPAIDTIPMGGSSLPTLIKLQNAPDVDITITMSVSGLDGVTVFPTALTFSAGVQNGTYAISTTPNVTTFGQGTISYFLSGTNMGVYKLEKSSQSFTVGPEDNKLPEVTGVGLVGLSRTSVTIAPVATKPGILYYMYALYGTAVPSYEDVKAVGPAAYPSTRSIYGNATVDSTLTTTFSLRGLTAQTPYAIYIYMDDLAGRRSMGCYVHNFTTLERYPTGQTQLRFVQAYLDEMQVENIVNSVGLLLSLDYRRVLTWDKTKKARQLITTKTSYLDLYIIDDPTTDNYPSPKDLLTRLSSKATALASLLPTLDLSWSIPANIWTSPRCAFLTSPMMSGYNSYNSLSFLSSLASDGVIYALVENLTVSAGTPLSQQISLGLNRANIATQAISHDVTGGTLTNTTFLNLAPATTYQVYITCGSLDPGYSYLLEDASVISMSWTTAPAPKRTSLNLDSSRHLSVFILALVLALSS